MVSWTRPALPRFRFRLAFLEEAKWRKPGFRRSNLPDAVNLNRFAAAFLVFRRAMDLGMGRRTIQAFPASATPFLGLLWFFSVTGPPPVIPSTKHSIIYPQMSKSEQMGTKHKKHLRISE
jgi:uncharacterized membrane protein